MNRHPTERKLNVKTNKKDDIIEFKHNNIIQSTRINTNTVT